MKVVVALVVWLSLLAVAHASETAEGLVEGGLVAYKEGGAKAAIEAWIKGSGLEGGKEALSQANTLRQVEDYYGKFEDYEIIKSQVLSKRAVMVLFVMNFSKGTTFGRFQAYREKTGNWVANQFMFHTDVRSVWPESMVFGE